MYKQDHVGATAEDATNADRIRTTSHSHSHSDHLAPAAEGEKPQCPQIVPPSLPPKAERRYSILGQIETYFY